MFFYPLSDACHLRPLGLSDTDELFALIETNRTGLRQWLPWLDATQSPSDTRAFIQATLQQWADNQGLVAAICDDQRIVGLIGLNGLEWANRIGYIGYWLGESAQGQGIMTAAVKALVNHGFTDLNLNRQVIACATQNARSRAIPERLGFCHEGTLRDAEWLYDRYVDHAIYACLQRDWQL